MIGLIYGTVAYQASSFILVDTGGVGYKVILPQAILSGLKLDDKVRIFTHTHVREDVLELYGFTNPEDLKLFELLISVSGVGCKTALGVFSFGKKEDIIRAVRENDVTFFTSVPRLGKKNAQKIIIELKSKLAEGSDFDFSDGLGDNKEVIAALKTFGFNEREARDAVLAIKDQGESVGEKIKLALKQLGK